MRVVVGRLPSCAIGLLLVAATAGLAQAPADPAAAPKALTPRERSLGLADGVRCGLTFSEVAGFDAKPGRGRNQGLKGPLSIDFARTAEDGPWVITGLRGKTPLGEATVTIRAVRFEPSDAPCLIALN